MTLEEIQKSLEDARRKAHTEARAKYGPNMTGPTSPIVNAARLHVIESTLATMLARESQYVGTEEEQAILELRDYWEAVAKEIAG